jgi:predicted porin
MKRFLTVAIGSMALMGGAEQASADITVYGSTEQALTITDNGTTNSKDITNGDTYVGFKATEDLGNGLSAFGDISLNIDSEGGNAATTRDAKVGISSNAGTITMGRQKNLTKVIGGAVDIFEGNSATVTSQARNNNTMLYTSPNMGGFTGSAMLTADGTTGDDSVDTNEYAVAYTNGSLSLGGVRLDDTVNNNQTITLMGAYTISGLTVAVAKSELDNNDSTANVETMTYAGSIDLGKNTLKAGFQDADEGNETTTLEAVHNFSNKTSAYVNFQNANPKSGAAETDTTSVGLRVNF